MGADSSKEKKANKIDTSEWVTIGEEADATIVKSNMGNGLGEVRVIPLDPKKILSKEMEVYSFRKTQPHIVRCLGAENVEAKSTTMCGNQSAVKVMTERIPKKWTQLPQLVFPETLYALGESLKGYELLHDKVGVFDVTPAMIGLDGQGEVKCWLNQNYAYNHPSFEKPCLQTTAATSGSNAADILSTNSSEAQMVRNIIEIIEQKCENGRFPTEDGFRDRLYRNSRNFDEAIACTENHIKDRNASSQNPPNTQNHWDTAPNTHKYAVPDRINLEAPLTISQARKNDQNPVGIATLKGGVYKEDIGQVKAGPVSTNFGAFTFNNEQHQKPTEYFSSQQAQNPIGRKYTTNATTNFGQSENAIGMPYTNGDLYGAKEPRQILHSEPVSVNPPPPNYGQTTNMYSRTESCNYYQNNSLLPQGTNTISNGLNPHNQGPISSSTTHYVSPTKLEKPNVGAYLSREPAPKQVINFQIGGYTSSGMPSQHIPLSSPGEIGGAYQSRRFQTSQVTRQL